MSRRAFISGLGAAILCAGVVTPALAQPPKSPPGGLLPKMFGGRGGAAAPAVARYVGDGVDFTFDRTSGLPLVQFKGSSEVIALTRAVGPRNDQIYKNDAGERVLVFTGLGGLTVYTPAKPEGVPASPVSGAVPSPIKLQTIQDAEDLTVRAGRIGYRISQIAQHRIGIDMKDTGPESWTVVGDVLNLVGDFFTRNQDFVRRDARFEHIERILIVPGDQPDIRPFYDTIQITIVPTRGPAGRPSTARIAQVLAR